MAEWVLTRWLQLPKMKNTSFLSSLFRIIYYTAQATEDVYRFLRGCQKEEGVLAHLFIVSWQGKHISLQYCLFRAIYRIAKGHRGSSYAAAKWSPTCMYTIEKLLKRSKLGRGKLRYLARTFFFFFISIPEIFLTSAAALGLIGSSRCQLTPPDRTFQNSRGSQSVDWRVFWSKKRFWGSQLGKCLAR